MKIGAMVPQGWRMDLNGIKPEKQWDTILEASTKIEKLIRAHKLIMKGDLSLFDKIYHQDYQSYNPRLGITNNLADDRVIYASVPRLCRL